MFSPEGRCSEKFWPQIPVKQAHKFADFTDLLESYRLKQVKYVIIDIILLIYRYI